MKPLVPPPTHTAPFPAATLLGMRPPRWARGPGSRRPGWTPGPRARGGWRCPSWRRRWSPRSRRHQPPPGRAPARSSSAAAPWPPPCRLPGRPGPANRPRGWPPTAPLRRAGQQPGQRSSLQTPSVGDPAGPADATLRTQAEGWRMRSQSRNAARNASWAMSSAARRLSGQRVGQPHHGVVLAEVERLEVLQPGRRRRVERVDVRLHHRHPAVSGPSAGPPPFTSCTCRGGTCEVYRCRHPTIGGVGRPPLRGRVGR
jgi:hypothetical protein